MLIRMFRIAVRTDKKQGGGKFVFFPAGFINYRT